MHWVIDLELHWEMKMVLQSEMKMVLHSEMQMVTRWEMQMAIQSGQKSSEPRSVRIQVLGFLKVHMKPRWEKMTEQHWELH